VNDYGSCGMDKDICCDDRKSLRKAMLAARDAIPANERNKLSKAIAANFFNYIKKTFRTAALYCPIGSEADTKELINEFNGIKLLYPKVLDDSRLSWGEPPLTPGCMGIMEPLKIVEFDADLIIIPCVAFDINRYRLGYGRGYFDKFLYGKTNLFKVCIAYESQKIASVFPQNHDVPMDAVVTDVRIY
jgi:5-formyltetrahydrofolate cyclo-ligase